MNKGRPNENVEIVILPDESKKRLTVADREKIKRLVQDHLLHPSDKPYRKVQVEVMRRPDGAPQSLVASMLRAQTYTADVVKMNVDSNYCVTSVELLSANP